VITHSEYFTLLEKMNHLGKEMEDIRKLLLDIRPYAEEGKSEAWDNLMRLSEEVSIKWQGPSGAQEVRDQRSKGY